MEQIARLALSLTAGRDAVYSPMQVAALGPMLQGFLMEQVDTAYADLLHAAAFNPYSQYCMLSEGGEIIWVIGALKSDAITRIIDPLSSIDVVSLRSVRQTFEVRSRKLESMDITSLLDTMKEGCEPKHRIRFLTPTSFKTHGEYAIMPSMRLIFQNLLMHYSQVYSGNNEVEEGILEYISNHAKITSYSLQSRYFAHSAKGKSKIPAFIGNLSIAISGPQAMQGLASMLLHFGEYAGVGIKTSMGMGAMKLL